jgi:hypothetical protein
MCMEDVRIGRKTLGRMVPVTCTTASQAILAGAPSRYALILGAPLSGTITYSTLAGVVSGLGFNITAGADPIKLTIQDEGDIVRQAWFVIGAAGGELAAVSEILLAEQ